MVFESGAQLRGAIAEKCAIAVSNTADIIRKKFEENLNQFYSEYTPTEYIRTGALESSLYSEDVRRYGNQHVSGAIAEVGFETPSYQHGWVRLQSGDYDWSSWSDEEILDVVMTGSMPHGDAAGGTAIWTKTIRDLGGKRGIENILKEELKKQGL